MLLLMTVISGDYDAGAIFPAEGLGGTLRAMLVIFVPAMLLCILAVEGLKRLTALRYLPDEVARGCGYGFVTIVGLLALSIFGVFVLGVG